MRRDLRIRRLIEPSTPCEATSFPICSSALPNRSYEASRNGRSDRHHGKSSQAKGVRAAVGLVTETSFRPRVICSTCSCRSPIGVSSHRSSAVSYLRVKARLDNGDTRRICTDM